MTAPISHAHILLLAFITLAGCQRPAAIAEPAAAVAAVEPDPDGAAAGEWQKPPTEASDPSDRASRLPGFRLLAPRFIIDDVAEIVVEGGAALASRGHGPLIRAVVVVGRDVERITAPITLERSDDRRSRSWRGVVEIPLPAAWEDGAVTVSWQPPVHPVPGPAAEPQQASAELVRQAFAAVAPAQREELATWVAEHNSQRPIWGRLPRWRNLTRALRQPEDPFAGLRGFVLRSYVSPLLERRQPYTVYVPEALSLQQPAPLLILLHGSGGDYRNLIADEAAGQRFETHPMLIANAGAHGHQEFRHMALQDVIAIIGDMQAKYPVDPERIYLQGISLGGRGTLEAAALLPDTFAALSAQGVYGLQRDLVDPQQLVGVDAVAQAYQARSDIRSWLPNIRHLPVEFCFGLDDGNTPPEQAQLFARHLRYLGADAVSVRSFPMDHNITLPHYDWATTRAWFLQHVRQSADRDLVHHRVANLRFNRQAWVTVDAVQDYARIGEVVARRHQLYTPITPASGLDRQLLLVATDNCTAVRLAAPWPVDTLIIDDRVLYAGEAVLRDWHLRRQGEVWQLVDAAEYDSAIVPGGDRSAKRPGCSGPIWDVWSSPFRYVYDDSGTAPGTELVAESARRSARWDVHWGERQLPAVALGELDEGELAERNIILFTDDVGRCPLLAGLELPRPFTGEAREPLRIALRPSPWRDAGYLLVVENRSGGVVDLHRLGWWDRGLRSDWLAADLQVDGDGDARQIRLRRAGSYGHDWQGGSVTETDYRGGAMLGPKSGGH